MTKKHYIKIAAIIAAMPDHAESLRSAKSSTARAFADALKLENPRFDRDRFLAACGVEA